MFLKRLLLIFLSAQLLSACGEFQIGVEQDPGDESNPVEEMSGLPNPASVYCRDNGYALEIRTAEDGSQYGVCIFPDGSECEEWAYYRGECSPVLSAGIRVAGWLGSVRTVTEDPTYDDALLFFPEGVGEVGLTGIDGIIEAEIAALRDAEPPGKYAHFWGTLTCENQDFGGCQLVVTRIRVGATETSGERVEGWVGTIVSGEFNGGASSVFIISGDYPMPFSIHTNDSALLDQIEGVRDTGTRIQVWGELMTGIPDVNGSRIQAERIQLLP
ncbi:MAG: DUF333 domain-containing protein [Anaerolineales bacterium]|nr:DUF333 domain-containing protein [Anaerolineales bacterium]